VASNADKAGKVVPSPAPSSTLRIIRAQGPPALIVNGVMRVKIAVDKIPSERVYFPPNFSAKIPPGI
jgi:hypothetical protein